MILYKYVKAETALKIIKNKSLFFNNPQNWNDPFDLLVNDPNHIEVPSKIWNLLNLKAKYLKGEATAQECLRLIEQNKYFEYTKESLVANNIVCCSFSEDWNNLLMWAHYADEHKGCVFAFEIDDEFLNANKFLFKIKYSYKRPQMELKENILFLDRFIKSMQDVIDDDLKNSFIEYSKKSNDWAYEEEWRLLCLKKDADYNDKTYRCFFNIPALSIKEIYFGERMERTTVNDIFSLLKMNSEFKHIKFHQAKSNKLEFKIDNEPFDITNWFTGHEDVLCVKKNISFLDKLNLYIFQRNSIFLKLDNFTIKRLQPELEKLIISKWQMSYDININKEQNM